MYVDTGYAVCVLRAAEIKSHHLLACNTLQCIFIWKLIRETLQMKPFCFLSLQLQRHWSTITAHLLRQVCMVRQVKRESWDSSSDIWKVRRLCGLWKRHVHSLEAKFNSCMNRPFQEEVKMFCASYTPHSSCMAGSSLCTNRKCLATRSLVHPHLHCCSKATWSQAELDRSQGLSWTGK